MEPITIDDKGPAVDATEPHISTTDVGANPNLTEDKSKAAALRNRALRSIDSGMDPVWRSIAHAALLAAIDAKGSATIDDARTQCPPPVSPRWWCALTASLSRKEVIECVGFREGIAPVTRLGLLRLWKRGAK